MTTTPRGSASACLARSWRQGRSPTRAPRIAKVCRSSNYSVLLEQLLLTRVLRHLATGDEHMLGAGRELEGVAGPDHHVAILAHLQRTQPVRHTPGASRFERDGPQRQVAI